MSRDTYSYKRADRSPSASRQHRTSHYNHDPGDTHSHREASQDFTHSWTTTALESYHDPSHINPSREVQVKIPSSNATTRDSYYNHTSSDTDKDIAEATSSYSNLATRDQYKYADPRKTFDQRYTGLEDDRNSFPAYTFGGVSSERGDAFNPDTVVPHLSPSKYLHTSRYDNDDNTPRPFTTTAYAHNTFDHLEEQPSMLKGKSREPHIVAPKPSQASSNGPLAFLRQASLGSADPLSFRSPNQPSSQTERIAAPPTPPFGTSKTLPFSLDPPPFTDADVPLPEPYNAAYPHPLSAYASMGVNEETRRVSGYDIALLNLFQSDPDRLRGTILSEAGRDDLLPPALTMLIFPGEGNGIPERLWSRFESFGAARVPVGVAGMPQYGLSTEGSVGINPLPPRMASLSHSNSMSSITSTMSAYGGISAHPSLNTSSRSSYSDLTSMASPASVMTGSDDYFSVQPSRSVRHASSLLDLHSARSTSSASYPRQHYLPPTPPSRAMFQATAHSSEYDLTPKPQLVPESLVQAQGGVASSPSTSDVFKTEMCRLWQQVGTCKYGDGCQYAHGLSELRTPFDAAIPPLTPPPDTSELRYYAPGPNTANSASASASIQSRARQSLPPQISQSGVNLPNQGSYRLDLRRASAPPHQDLSTVDEHHEHESPPQPSENQGTWSTRVREDNRAAGGSGVLPIGAERQLRQDKRERLVSRNGRSPDLATVAEWFSTRSRPISNVRELDPYTHHARSSPVDRTSGSWSTHTRALDIPSITSQASGDLTPRASSSSLSSSSGLSQSHSHFPRLQLEPRLGPSPTLVMSTSLTPSTSTSTSAASLSDMSFSTVQTPLSSSVTSASGWPNQSVTGATTNARCIRSPSNTGSSTYGSGSGSVSTSGSFGSAYDKRITADFQNNKDQPHQQRGLAHDPANGKDRPYDQSQASLNQSESQGQKRTPARGNLSMATWDFSTGKSIWC